MTNSLGEVLVPWTSAPPIVGFQMERLWREHLSLTGSRPWGVGPPLVPKMILPRVGPTIFGRGLSGPTVLPSGGSPRVDVPPDPQPSSPTEVHVKTYHQTSPTPWKEGGAKRPTGTGTHRSLFGTGGETWFLHFNRSSKSTTDL